MTQFGSGTTGRATDEPRHDTSQVTEESKDAGRRVAETAKDEAGRVADEAKVQARRVYHELSGEVQKQADEQQHKAANGLRTMSQELESMSQSSEQQGMAADLVHQAAQRVGDVAGWLEQRDAASMMREVKYFARRHPGVFIAIAAGAGLAIGRVIRASTSEDSHSERPQLGTTAGYEETTPVYEETIAAHEEPMVPDPGMTATATPGYEESVYDETTRQSGEVRR